MTAPFAQLRRRVLFLYYSERNSAESSGIEAGTKAGDLNRGGYICTKFVVFPIYITPLYDVINPDMLYRKAFRV